jgi:hypothetical protein
METLLAKNRMTTTAPLILWNKPAREVIREHFSTAYFTPKEKHSTDDNGEEKEDCQGPQSQAHSINNQQFEHWCNWSQ